MRLTVQIQQFVCVRGGGGVRSVGCSCESCLSCLSSALYSYEVGKDPNGVNAKL